MRHNDTLCPVCRGLIAGHSEPELRAHFIRALIAATAQEPKKGKHGCAHCEWVRCAKWPNCEGCPQEQSRRFTDLESARISAIALSVEGHGMVNAAKFLRAMLAESSESETP
jgi:hypothetical protein